MKFGLPAPPTDIWLAMREAQQFLRDNGCQRGDDWLRRAGDDGTILCRRTDTNERQFSVLSLNEFVTEQRQLRHKQEVRRGKKQER